MNELGNAEAVAQQFGLAPVPESVTRLTRLLARQDADLEEIARLIAQDKALAARLLRAANPAAATERDYDITDVDQALMRGGLGCVLLLALVDPLTRAVMTTFHTMLAIRLALDDRRSVPPITGQHFLAEVELSGRASGRVHLRLAPESAHLIAARMLGLEAHELTEAGEIEDAVCELVNMVAGNFHSNLCDAGLNCRLTPPRITQTMEFRAQSSVCGLTERMAFRSPELAVFLDVCLNPWNAS